MKTKMQQFCGLTAKMLMIAGMFLSLSILSGCKKDSNSDNKEGYSNIKDDSTTRIITTIPRIALTKLKSPTKVNLYLSVTDQNGNAFKDFNQYNFTIKQVCVGSTDTTVVGGLSFGKLNTVGKRIITPLVLDYSGSMEDYAQNMQNAVANYISLKEADDFIELIKFSDYSQVVQPFATDTAVLLNSLRRIWPGEWQMTAFYDAVGQGLIDADSMVNHNFESYMPAVIAFTDGNDNQSYYYDNASVISKSLDTQIPIYTLGFGDVYTGTLQGIADQTGGRYYFAPNILDLKNLYARISGQLKNLYQVSWTFNNPSCSQVKIIVEASYTCKNGTFKSTTVKSFVPFKK